MMPQPSRPHEDEPTRSAVDASVRRCQFSLQEVDEFCRFIGEARHEYDLQRHERRLASAWRLRAIREETRDALAERIAARRRVLGLEAAA